MSDGVSRKLELEGVVDDDPLSDLKGRGLKEVPGGEGLNLAMARQIVSTEEDWVLCLKKVLSAGQ